MRLHRATAAAMMGGGAVSTAYTGLVANYCRGLSTLNTGNKQIMSRTAHDAIDGISACSIAIANFRLLATGGSGEVTGAGSVTVTASIEYPANTFTQVTFNTGSTSGTVADGDMLFSDTVTLSTPIPAGSTFWVRMFKTGTLGITYNAWQHTARGDQTRVGASGLTDQTMVSGSLTTGSAGGNVSCPPFMVIGTTTKASILLVGDSLTHGYKDFTESTTAAGPGLRGIIAKSLTSSYAFQNISSGGLKASDWGTLCTKRDDVLPYFSHYVVTMGRNDLEVGVAGANATRTSVEAIISAILAAKPTAKISTATIVPTSTSTDSWATTANQTASGNNASRVTYNGYVRTGAISGVNNGYFEIADQVENARDAGIFKATGVANGYTDDGIHPVTAGYDLIVSAGAVTLSSFTYP